MQYLVSLGIISELDDEASAVLSQI